MFWERKRPHLNHLIRDIALLDADLSKLEDQIGTRLRRIDDQLREIHQRLDRMEGIR